jgi:tellurite resistance protein
VPMRQHRADATRRRGDLHRLVRRRRRNHSPGYGGKSGSRGSRPDGYGGGRRVTQKQYARPGGVSLLPPVKYMMPRMTSEGNSKPPDRPTDLTPFAAELRGTVLLEAMVAAFAIISFADRTSSLIERWRLLDVVSDDPLLAALPKAVIGEEWAIHRQAFTTDPEAARKAALLQVARLAAEPHKARMVVDACARIVNADRKVRSAEVQAIRDIAAALRL